MNRPWKTWLAFGACLAVGLAAMGWLSLAALRLDAAERAVRRRADAEESVRLALWRMESVLAPLLAQESGRPPAEYASFPRIERAFGKSLSPLAPGAVVSASPLLSFRSPFVRLHFEAGPKDRIASPQSPVESERALAERILGAGRISEADARLAEFRRLVQPIALEAYMSKADPPTRGLALLAPPDPNPQEAFGPGLAKVQREQAAQHQDVQSSREFGSRAGRVKVASSGDNLILNDPDQAFAAPNEGAGLQPLWIDRTLVLARRISRGKGSVIQGCWLDWEAIRRALLDEVRDLLPAAKLVAASPGPSSEPGRRLASLPVRLESGEVPTPPLPPSPLRIVLGAAWAGILLAGAAVAALLHGAVSLSERRGAFVSAVTHELRTPLTTFRMYSEMLSLGMVPEERRAEYLSTLQSESNRLSALVENVLAYARLERGRLGDRARVVGLDALVSGCRERLAARAAPAGFSLEISGVPSEALDVRADPGAVDQILFNLVDNACKYAAGASDRRLHLEAERAGRGAIIRVRDHGPGLPPEQVRRLFTPFSKSAREAAESAPGVGLGLALSWRLARAMGGELRLESTTPGGVAFVLRLPAA